MSLDNKDLSGIDALLKNGSSPLVGHSSIRAVRLGVDDLLATQGGVPDYERLMVPEREMTVPPRARQTQLIEEIGIHLADVVEGRWSTLIFTHRNLSEFFNGRIEVHRPAGCWEYVRPPEVVFPMTDELRRVMYQPRRGAWFSARWVVARSGGDASKVSTSVVFNYDDEPVWRWPAHPGLYALDLELFPRDPEYMPDWLRHKVESARGSL